MTGIWFGVVSVSDGLGSQQNNFYALWATGEGDALNQMVAETRKVWPKSPVVNSAAYRVRDDLIRRAAAGLPPAG